MFLKTHYSILKSANKILDSVKYMKELGFKAIILADNQLFGALEFIYSCNKEEILPIISVEYEEKGVKYLLIAKNGKGFKDLSYIVSTKNFKKSDDIFVVLLELENLKTTVEKVDFIGLTGENSGIVNSIPQKILIAYASEYNIPVIPYHAAYHKTEADYRTTNALIAIGTEQLMDNVNALGLGISPSKYILKKEEFIKKYPSEWIRNYMEIIKSCSIEGYSFGNPTPPHFQFTGELIEKENLSSNTTEEDLFAYMSRKGLENRLKHISSENHSEYKKRLEYEIGIINQMKFPGYMLIVQDFVRAAKAKGIPVGPGRGSAAGSLVAYSLEITNIDPLPYDLLFERFLNPERVSMPDIDMDFCQSRRQEIIDYVIEKYGKEKVSQIVTFGSLAAKGSIRDIARIMSYNLQAADRFAKIIPEKPGITLAEAYESEKDKIDAIIKKDPQANRVWDFAQKVEGLNRNLGVHAAGLVITDTPVWEKAPLTNVNNTQVVQFDGKYLEDVDLIKFDFLGLKTLSVIQEAIELIDKNHEIKVSFDLLNPTDKIVYDLISTGNTAGIFQIESDGMQKLCKRMGPSRFEDLIALLALYRPGPMESGMLDDFVARKKGEKPIRYFFDDFEKVLKPILEPTYGVIVYQEQVMKIVQEVGGFSLGEADIIRRAMGKKNVKYMEEKAIEFAEGAEKKGLSKEHAVELFDLIQKFAGYGFNKSHSAAYAVLTYQTAWLKAYYPAEFFSALMNFDLKDQDKIAKYISEAKKLNLGISSIDINTSSEMFNTDGSSIQFALRAIKGVGAGSKPCLEARNKKPFENFKDFIIRSRNGKIKMNKRVYEGLAYSGALDSFGVPRKAMIENSEFILKAKEDSDIWEKLLHITEDFTLAQKIKFEKEKVGMYITDPFQPVRKYIDPYQIPELDKIKEGREYILVFPEKIIERTAKKSGNKFAILTGYYNGKKVDILAFSNAMKQLKSVSQTRPIILEINVKADGGIFLSTVIAFKKSTIQAYFLPKENLKLNQTEKVIEVEKEITIQEGDFKSLIEAVNNKIPMIHIKGSVSYSIVR